MSEPTAPPSSEPSIAQAAAVWVARLASGDITRSELNSLRTWLSADPHHQQAFDRARTTWAGLAPLESPARRSLRPRRVGAVAATFAAAAAACLVVAVLVPTLVPHDLSSPVGEVQVSTLSDGTRIWLDSGAAADFHVTESTRTLDVVRGRIHVVVEPDAGRPFVVRAADAAIRDVGTAFSVDKEGRAFHVAVSEGAVEVTQHGVMTLLDAGRSASFIVGQRAEPNPFNPSTEAAWRDDRIVLDHTTIADALRQADRYRPGKILLTDAETGARRVSGSLSIKEIDASLDALADSERLRLMRLPGLLLVTTSTPRTPSADRR